MRRRYDADVAGAFTRIYALPLSYAAQPCLRYAIISDASFAAARCL